jgi:large conductance mechanosensitive channel
MNPTNMVSGGLAGFMTFIREQGVVGLAVGFILGGAVSKVVSALVSDLINPALGYILGSTEGLKALQTGAFMWGDFIAVFVDFVVIAAVVYFIVKGLGLDKLDAKK